MDPSQETLLALLEKIRALKTQDFEGINKVLETTSQGELEELFRVTHVLNKLTQTRLSDERGRYGRVERNTNETRITCIVDLDGNGTKIDVNTGIGKLSFLPFFSSVSSDSFCFVSGFFFFFFF